jgi:hypothetical protein
MFQIVENERNVRGIFAEEVRRKVGRLRSPRLGVTTEVPFTKELDLGVFTPEIRHLWVLIRVLALGQNGLVNR